MKITKALVETGLFESCTRVERWIGEGKILVNGEKIKRDIELKAGHSYAIELLGNKLNGKYLLNAPTNSYSKYTACGPIR